MRRRSYVHAAVAVLGLVASACGSGGGETASTQATSTVTTPAPAVEQPTVSSSAVTSEGAERRSNLTFYVITHGLDGPGWAVAQRGAEQAGKDLGINVLYEESNLDTQKQSQMIMAAVTHHPSGIAISLADTQGLAAAAKAVTAANIPLYTLNSGVNDYKAIGAVTHVGQNEILAGEEAGERFTKLGATSVLCARIELANIGIDERCKGLKNSFKGTVRDEYIGVETDPAGQAAQMAALLQANPDIDAILGTGPNATGAAATAAQTAGRNVVVGGFDVPIDLLNAIKAGTVAFSVDQQMYLEGYLPVVLMYLQVTTHNPAGGGLPIYTGPNFVDKDNVDQMIDLVTAGTH